MPLWRQRQHVGEGEAAALPELVSSQTPVRSIDRHRPAGLGEDSGDRDADDAGADDRDVVGAPADGGIDVIGAIWSGRLCDRDFGSSGRVAIASLTIFSTAARRSPDSGWRGMRTRSLVPIASTSASLMFCTR